MFHHFQENKISRNNKKTTEDSNNADTKFREKDPKKDKTSNKDSNEGSNKNSNSIKDSIKDSTNDSNKDSSKDSKDSKGLEALKLKQMRELQQLQLMHLRQIHEQQLRLAMAEGKIVEKAKEEVCSRLECTHEETLEEICKFPDIAREFLVLGRFVQ